MDPIHVAQQLAVMIVKIFEDQRPEWVGILEDQQNTLRLLIDIFGGTDLDEETDLFERP